MARIVYSGLVTHISGSVGGSTFQRNGYGFSIKNKPLISKPLSREQMLRQSLLAQVVSSWNNLQNSDRSTWNAFAASYPQYANHNNNSRLNGYNLYSKINFFNLLSGNTFMNSPSMVWYSPDALTPSLYIWHGSFFIQTEFATSEGNYIVLYFISRIQRSGTNFIGTKTRLLFSDFSNTNSFNITSLYNNLFGSVPIAGDRLFLSAQFVGVGNAQFLAAKKYVLTVGAPPP